MLSENINLLSKRNSSGEYYYGMDFSLTSTGLVVLDKGGELVDKTSVTSSSSDGTRTQRVADIAYCLEQYLDNYTPRIFSSESVTVSRQIKSMMLLCNIEGAVLQTLDIFSREIDAPLPYLLSCNASSIKTCASGDGKATKGTMQMEVLSRWGVKTDTDDEADAFTAAKLGYFLDKFKRVYLEFSFMCESVAQEEELLMDLCKGRHEEFYKEAKSQGLERQDVDTLVGILSGSGNGGSGMNLMSENDKNYYYEAVKRLKEK